MKKNLVALMIAAATMAGCSSTGSSEVTSAAERGLDTETLLATNTKPFIAASEIPQGDAEGLKSQLLNLKDGDELIILLDNMRTLASSTSLPVT
ncbi:hypothetical protein JCM19239_5140 [Vibrio variabilis]|uniref:Uncharacterized protein n=1 Tax=Vibrio variabilis TaxID=990271 RepID=A0ABQ0JAK4_9VIBR|nr:hypothetical protein JCM19239_5140 [Vibrio variabilis]